MLNLCNINSHSVKVQALIKKSGLPELEVLKAIAQYGEDIQLDLLPRVNSEMFLKTALGCLETSKVTFASISDILDYTKTETIEDANIALNNEFRDLEIRLTSLGSAAILDLKHRPTIFTKPKTNIPRTYIELATKVYSKFPLLSYIGTAEEYAEYIQSIFKNSITRGTIYWHGTGTDFSDGFNSAIRGIGSGAPETKTRNDFYFAKQGETVLQYIPKLNVPEGLSRNDRKELCWNNLWWELKEILGNGKSLTDEAWRNKVITELPTKIPNKHGVFNRDSGGSNGTYLTERKNHYRLNTPSGEVTLGFMSDAEFLDLFGFELGKDSFNSWTLRNYLKFAELFDSEYLNILGIYPAIVNVHKGKAVTEFNLATNYAERGVFDKVKETHAEAVISDSANNEFGSDVLIMTNIGKTAEELKNNNKIHWLGSKLDIEGFKKFIDKNHLQQNNKNQNEEIPLSKLRLSELTKGLSNNFTKVLLRDVTDKLRNLYGIQINLVTTEELKSELFKEVIANPHLTKGFILDGLIYINADTASLDTPIHELLHMFLGGIKYSNPTLYFKLVSSVELLPLYSHYLEMGTMTRGDLNEELFVEEFAKYIVRRPSLFDSIDPKDLNTLLYDINRVLDSFFMGEASFQESDVRNTFTKSILALADQYGSDILNIKDSIDSARLHRLLANEKSDLLNNGELEEICE